MRRIEPHFPLSHGVPRVDDRRIISGIIFVSRVQASACGQRFFNSEVLLVGGGCVLVEAKMITHPKRLERHAHLLVKRIGGGKIPRSNMILKVGGARDAFGEGSFNRMPARIMNGHWVFQAPVGYKFVREPGGGALLKPDEPAASVIREAFEGYASGRFETQADVMRFLQANPLFPKDKTGIVRHQRVTVLLTQCIYAGYVERPNWDVSRRPGVHEGLISLETFQIVQDRLSGMGYAARRKNLNEDFSLRGFVEYADCGTPLTACWSKGSKARYPYYLCPKRGCDAYGKSIRRELIEGQFEELLREIRPTPTLFKIASRMFRQLWDHRIRQASAQADSIAQELWKVEKEIEQLLDRVVAATVPSVISAYENRIRKIEEQKWLLKEKLGNCARPASSFDDALRTALEFLANPWNLWDSDRL